MSSNAMVARVYGEVLQGIYANPPFRSNPFVIGYSRSVGLGLEIEGNPRANDESAFQRHGLRPKTFKTRYFDVEQNLKEEDVKKRISEVRQQGAKENLLLASAMDHGAMLESGAVTLRGDWRIRLGSYVMFPDASRAYVTALTQTFRQGTAPGDGHFTTKLGLERGRGYIVEDSGSGKG